MTEFENIGNALNALKQKMFPNFEEESGLSNGSIFSETEDFREIFLEIPDSFWQIIFSRRNAQPQERRQNPP